DLFLTSAGADGNMKLFRNTAAKFTDVSTEAGLPKQNARACAAADYDNDGRSDLAISTADRVLLLHNEGSGKFRDVTEEAGLGDRITRASSLLWVDYDHDGDADLIVLAAENRGKQVAVFRNNG